MEKISSLDRSLDPTRRQRRKPSRVYFTLTGKREEFHSSVPVKHRLQKITFLSYTQVREERETTKKWTEFGVGGETTSSRILKNEAPVNGPHGTLERT